MIMSKKLSLILVVMMAAWISVCAQPIMSYDFASSVGTYTEITDGTVLTTVVDDSENGITFDNKIWVSTEATDERVTSAGFEIGFDFVYNNQNLLFISNFNQILILNFLFFSYFFS